MNEDRSPLNNLLAGLNRDQLQSLLLKLAEQEPSLIPTVEKQVALWCTSSQVATPSQVTPPKPAIVVDTKAIRRQVRSSIHSLDRMRSSEAYWHVGAVVNEIGQLVEQAWALIKADDGRKALTVLEAITEEYIGDWEHLDDSDGEASGFFSDLGAAWTEAILSADLTREEREQWADQLATWQTELDDYGVDEAFDGPQTAALDGWDYLCWLLGTSVRKSGGLRQYNISLLSLSLVHIWNCRENREQTFPFSVNIHADASAMQQKHDVFV
jgi:hypothetical protein